MLEEHVKANQQEKTANRSSRPKQLWSLKRGGEHNHFETALEQILELLETTWPAGQAPRVNEMVHRARSVLERSGPRSKEHNSKSDMSAHAATGDRYQTEKMEHGAADDLDHHRLRRTRHESCRGPIRKVLENAKAG